MGRVFRRTDLRPLPRLAKLSKNSKGQSIATWVTRGRRFSGVVSDCGTKYTWVAPHWSIEYVPANRTEPIVKATECTDKAWAERVLRDVEIREQNKRMGFIDASQDRKQDARKKPISEHIGDYIADLRSMKRTAEHLRDTGKKVREVCSEGRINTVDDIQLSTVRTALAAIIQRRNLSDQTRNHFIAKFKAFVNWLVDDDRLATQPL